MTQEEFNYIKDSFSQILDDIGGNPDWYDAAKAIASDLGTLERQLEERVTKLPSNLDEAAEEYAVNHQSHDIFDCYGNPESDVIGKRLAFMAGAKWGKLKP